MIENIKNFYNKKIKKKLKLHKIPNENNNKYQI